MSFPSRELALHCARIVDQKGGEQVRVLQLPAESTTFDYVVLVTANSDRLTNALVEEVWHFCKRHQVPRLPVEGESGWMLIDCYEVVVHALTPEKREFYDIDTLWQTGREVPWMKEAKNLADPDKPTPAAKPAPKRAKTAVRAKKEDAGNLAAIPVPGTPTLAKPRRRAAPATTATAKPATRRPAAPKAGKPAAAKPAATRRRTPKSAE